MQRCLRLSTSTVKGVCAGASLLSSKIKTITLPVDGDIEKILKKDVVIVRMGRIKYYRITVHGLEKIAVHYGISKNNVALFAKQKKIELQEQQKLLDSLIKTFDV